MSNSLSASFATVMSKEMQMLLQKKAIYRELASFKEEANLRKGQTVSRPYRSRVVGQTYTRGGSYSAQDLTDTNEQLTVNTTKCIPFYIDKFDAVQHEYAVQTLYAQDAVIEAQNILDGEFLAEVANASSSNTIDDSDFGGTSGNGLTVTAANVLQIFTKASKKLDRANVPLEDRFMVISPDFKAVLVDALGGKESSLGDSTGLNGNIGSYGGFKLYLSNATYWTGALTIGAVPTAGETVVVNGVTFTWRDTGDVNSAGEVYYGLNTTAAVVNLAAAINNPSTTDAGIRYAVSGTKDSSGYSDQEKLRNVVATAASATSLTLAVKDQGYITFTETMANGGNLLTAGKSIQHLLYGRKGMIDMVVQVKPDVEVKDVSGKLGKDIVPNMLFGKKTFLYGTQNIGDIKVETSAF